MISTPSSWRATRHPNALTSAADRMGTIAPPMPMPKYATPIALPRAASNQRDSSTWFGSGPPQT